MQDWWVRLRKRARVDAADAPSYNEENHGDNGMLSVTCAWAVTHTIARDGVLRNAYVDTGEHNSISKDASLTNFHNISEHLVKM